MITNEDCKSHDQILALQANLEHPLVIKAQELFNGEVEEY